jgi:hypothetical protein
MNIPLTNTTLNLGPVSVSAEAATDSPVCINSMLGVYRNDPQFLGSATSVDHQISFLAGGALGPQSIETLVISSPLGLASVTVVPTLAISGGPAIASLNIPLFWAMSGGVTPDHDERLLPWNAPGPQNEVTISPKGCTRLVMSVNQHLPNWRAIFQSYLQANNYPAVTFVLGFSVKAIACTPSLPMRTVRWKCTTGPDWQWRSGSPGTPGFSAQGDNIRQGLITLPSNPGYWFPCVDVVLPGNTTGNAYLRYFNDNGVDKVQAITVAQNNWIEQGDESETMSQTRSTGGINLTAELV